MLAFAARALLRVPPEALWAFLADTDRLNRAIGLDPVRFVPLPAPGRYRAETRALGLKVEYDEFPFDWVERRYYRVLRRFRSGPILEVSGGIRLKAVEGGTEIVVTAEVVPRNWAGALMAKLALKKKATHDVLELARAFERHLREGAPPPAPPPPSLLDERLLEERLEALEDAPVAAGLAARLDRHLRTASDLEVVRMRPFELADAWGADRMESLRLFLYAARAGALDLAWSVLCPGCRAATAQSGTLAELRAQAHCETCGIRYDADLAASVEARFTVNPAVRRARAETYCIGGPANAPHVVAQLRLGPGETRREELDLPPGPYRVRCAANPGIVAVQAGVEGAGALRADVREDGLRAGPGTLRAGAVALEAANALAREVLLLVERETWGEGAATAALVTSLQDFRDLFPGEAVAPGSEIGIANLAILFTDLKGSTELYGRIGDTRAFEFVQAHFRFLVSAVARHRGGVVKTMGDAVMASFAAGRDALEAAVEMQERWEEFRRGGPAADGVSLKIGLHRGPVIAINNKGRLDYFGTTVNMAARVQGESRGRDVVFTRAVEEEAAAREFLEARGFPRESLTVPLKGLKGEHALGRIYPAGAAEHV